MKPSSGETQTQNSNVPEDRMRKKERAGSAVGYVIVGDNLGMRSKARHPSRTHANKDHHFFNLIAVKKRICLDKTYHVQSNLHKEKCLPPVTDFLPSVHDNECLKEDFKILVGRILAKHVPELEWLNEVLPDHIHHKNLSQVTKKTEAVCLGILNKSENDTSGIIDIMSFIQGYVPESLDKPIPLLSFGDLLTVEREINAQEDRRNSRNSNARLEGIIPCLSDFHFLGNFLEAVYKLIYEKKSAGDIGTLYAAKNFLNAVNSPHHPMDDPDSVMDLIEKYTSALVLACYETFKTKLQGRMPRLKHEKEKMKEEILDHIVNEFALPKMPDFEATMIGLACSVCKKPFKRIAGLRKHILEQHRDGGDGPEAMSNVYVCPHCPKVYKKASSLKSHMGKKHEGKDLIPTSSSESNSREEDHIFNYSRNALALGLLCMDFVDARKHGDGERILKLYSCMMLFFKLAGSSKYSYYDLYTLAQVKFLLPKELADCVKSERFVNERGKVNTNYEIDRYIEHRNKAFKLNARNLIGKVTQQSLDRISGSYEVIEKLMQSYDQQIHRHKPSGKHKKDEALSDIVELSKQFSARKIFDCIPGRFHHAFPGFQSNLLQGLDLFELNQWIQSCIKKFSNLAVYKSL